MPAGKMSVRPGASMAAAASFEVTVFGKSSHAAAPHQGVDAIMVGSEIVSSLQTISSRVTNPIEGIVISVTQFNAGNALNVLPDEAVLRGYCAVIFEGCQHDFRKHDKAYCGKYRSGTWGHC